MSRSTPNSLYLKILSPREIELARLLGFGWEHAKVAAYAGITVATSRTYHSNLCRKLGLHNRAGLMRWGIKTGLVDFNAEPAFEAAPEARR